MKQIFNNGYNLYRLRLARGYIVVSVFISSFENEKKLRRFPFIRDRKAGKGGFPVEKRSWRERNIDFARRFIRVREQRKKTARVMKGGLLYHLLSYPSLAVWTGEPLARPSYWRIFTSFLYTDYIKQKKPRITSFHPLTSFWRQTR